MSTDLAFPTIEALSEIRPMHGDGLLGKVEMGRLYCV